MSLDWTANEVAATVAAYQRMLTFELTGQTYNKSEQRRTLRQRMAWFKRRPNRRSGLIFHIDRGSQYASRDYRDVLIEYGITASMSRRGDCWDNACSETLLGSLKVERLHGQSFKTGRQAMDEVISWMLWYDRIRLHSTLAYVSPMQFEEDRLANQPRQASA